MTSVLLKPDVESPIWITCLPEDMWEYWYDLSKETRWHAGVNSTQCIANPRHGIGSSGLHVMEAVGDWPWKVTE